MNEGKVALVTGASRGVGAGIARGLGELGYTVYVTGRSLGHSKGVAFNGKSLPGTLKETVAAVNDAGGHGIAVCCDHSDDNQVAELFQHIMAKSGRLDMLVNNAAYLHTQLLESRPFWEKDLESQNIIDVGLRSSYVASWHAAKIMVPQGSGIIGFTSSPGASCYMHGPAYGAQKAGIDKLAHDMEHDLRGTGVIAVSIWLGPQRTERSNEAIAESEQYEQFMAVAENPEFTAHILDAIDRSPDRTNLSGQTLYGAEIAKALGITDRGVERPSYRDMLGAPREKNPVALY